MESVEIFSGAYVPSNMHYKYTEGEFNQSTDPYLWDTLIRPVLRDRMNPEFIHISKKAVTFYSFGYIIDLQGMGINAYT